MRCCSSWRWPSSGRCGGDDGDWAGADGHDLRPDRHRAVRALSHGGPLHGQLAHLQPGGHCRRVARAVYRDVSRHELRAAVGGLLPDGGRGAGCGHARDHDRCRCDGWRVRPDLAGRQGGRDPDPVADRPGAAAGPAHRGRRGGRPGGKALPGAAGAAAGARSVLEGNAATQTRFKKGI